jgi:hypothetical protein
MSVPQLDFRPYVEISGVYDTGLTGVSVNSQGKLGNAGGEGVMISGGVSGLHSWRRTKVGLNYNASFAHYTQQTFYDYVNQNLLLSVTQQLARHIILSLTESGGLFTQNFNQQGLPQTVPFDPSTVQTPTTDFFNNRTYFVNSQARLIYQKSARLSFALSGWGSLVRYRSSALYGSNGASATGDVQYRLTRTSTLGAAYSYVHYGYTGILGTMDLHSVSVTYAWRLNRWWEISGYGGFARSESKFVELVPLDPVIQALFGVQQGLAISYRTIYVPNVSLRISRTFPRGVLYANGGRTIVPGNGLFLTSVSTTVGAGYGYTGLRRWSLGASVSYYMATSMGNLIGHYNTFTGGFTASRQILPSVHFVTSFSVRRYSSPDYAFYNRPLYDARVGLGFSPGNIPLRIW